MARRIHKFILIIIVGIFPTLLLNANNAVAASSIMSNTNQLSQHLVRNSRDTRSRLTLIQHYKKLGAYKKAMTTINEGLKYNPNDMALLFKQALLYIDIGNYEKGLEVVKRMRKIRPYNKKLIRLETLATEKIEQHSSITVDLTNRIKQNPNSLAARAKLIDTLLQKAHYSDAIKLIKAALMHSPNNPTFLSRLAITQLKMSHFESALITLRKLNTVNPNAKWQQLTDIANKYLYKEQVAISHLRGKLAGNPRSNRARIKLAVAYMQYGKYRSALTSIEQGLKLSPGSPELLYTQARVYYRMGNYSEALTTLRHLLRVAPGHRKGRNIYETIKSRLST